MPTLDTCINNIFGAGNIGSDAGTVTPPEFSGYLLTEDGFKIVIMADTGAGPVAVGYIKLD